MNNIQPYDITQDPNMTDDVIRFYESQIQAEEQDGIRSPILSNFTINEIRESTGLGGPFPRFTAGVDSYGSVNLIPGFSTLRTTDGLWDGYKQVSGYRALQTGRYILEGDIQISGGGASGFSTLNGTYGFAIEYPTLFSYGAKTIQHPRVITNGGTFNIVHEATFRQCIYMRAGQYFILKALINAALPRRAVMTGSLRVISIEDKFITGQT